MDKELISIQIKIVIQDGGNLVKNKVKAPTFTVKAEWNWSENGKKTLSLVEDGYSPMVHIMKENSLITNPTAKEFGTIQTTTL